MGQLESRSWQGKWIANPDATENWKGASRFRRHFDALHEVARARVYISGLGHYELLLNGNKIGDHELDPGWTDYDQTVLYTTYDITPQLKSGVNIVQIELGNGFYHVPGGKYTKFKDSFGTPTCLADIVIEYASGACERISTDGSWQASKNPKPGVYVVDLGQNFSGWPRIRVSGAAGSKVVLTCAELLMEEGLLNQKWTGCHLWAR
ncbi:hypothetical protein ASG89_00195 [Paenibacillus sp. Soil766]|uniref:family 78 glycoside hydrolase catalytic domain n=1 Tax=Paenibacillus sp. Soil766 TaxID=1736404 RepID=UPI000709B07F|nr:family 78 glycoside hydrolase catalytic domain [Paenibacillus sp. Soil766]KRF10010.1 hypothetical protein ASG89_00195 [Paenibacillus sp. Soil766]